ncbi:YolD-like family protein [Lysinibacillus piscis]|uniref:YolD-like family protein n=1 Tax=Lysinibacillus piscis TaxID=2518931 RepID=A0ABQ5NKW0_9BACI|nr:YolD-like family protein [Lysinibacillus sp. KH24]GLC88989.1 hypothetical protein LYSBPC_21160 [Lysinibacillus sp. KH24]
MVDKKETTSKKKEPKHPTRDEFELEELATVLTEAMEEKAYKNFAIYKKDELLTGVVVKMDANTKLIHIQDKYSNIYKIHFLDILSVSHMDD